MFACAPTIYPPPVKNRLLLGPLMIAALIALLWFDEWLGHSPLPTFIARFFGLPADAPFPPGLALLAVGLLLVPLAARELGAIFHAGGVGASRRVMALAAVAGLIVSAVVPIESSPLHAVAMVATLGAIVLVSSLVWHIRDKNLHGATAAAGAAMFAFIYLGLMFGFLLAMRREHSAWVVLAVLVITKSCDIGALFTGKAIGRHKLIPWLSPGKTWEGLMGGMVTSALVAWGCVLLARNSVGIGAAVGPRIGDIPDWAILVSGATLGLVGQAGDLLESALKRDAGLKDSGKTIPGFGGVLDVIDSILLTAPVAFWILTMIER